MKKTDNSGNLQGNWSDWTQGTNPLLHYDPLVPEWTELFIISLPNGMNGYYYKEEYKHYNTSIQFEVFAEGEVEEVWTRDLQRVRVKIFLLDGYSRRLGSKA